MRLEETAISNRDIDISDADSVHFLGPNLTLQNCKIILRVSARSLTVKAVTFENCEVVATRKLLNFRWYSAAFRRCKFTGHYVGCGFGKRSEHYDPSGDISDCDLSSAILDGCDFRNVDVDRLILPKWPCFYFLEPARHRDDLRRLRWPGNLDFFIDGVVSEAPDDASILVFYAPSVIKRFGSNEAELQNVLQEAPGAFF